MKLEEYMESELSGNFTSKTGRQEYGAWVHGDPFYAYEGQGFLKTGKC